MHQLDAEIAEDNAYVCFRKKTNESIPSHFRVEGSRVSRSYRERRLLDLASKQERTSYKVRAC